MTKRDFSAALRSGRNDVVVRLWLAMVGFIAADLRFIEDKPPTGTK